MITKEQVLEKAKELGLTLTDEEVEQFVKDGKLPEKHDDLEKAEVKDLVKIIKEMRDENAKRRLNEKKLQDKIDEANKEKEKQKQKALEEQGEFKKLYEEALAKANGYEPIVNEYTEYQNKKRETLKTQFGDKWIESFNTVPISELEVLAGKLTATQPPDTGTGNHKGNPPNPDKNNDGYVVEYKSLK